MASKSSEFAVYVPALILSHFREDPTPPTCARGNSLPAVALFADIAGSTKIACQLATLGRLIGPEEMLRILNAFYDPLISLLRDRGGDVVGFAGDAVLAIWPADGAEGFAAPVRQATQAALEVQRKLNNLELTNGITLSLRICIGAGELHTAIVGGRQEFWQLVAYGTPLQQIRSASDVARVGEVYLSREACEHLAGATIDPQPGGGAFITQLAVQPPLPASSELPDASTLPEACIRPFVQKVVQESIDSGLSEYLDQSRTVSVLFVKFEAPNSVTPTWERMRDVMVLIQEATARYEGTVVQFIEDDKGLVAVLAFGLPPLGHEDDARRAVEAAAFLRHIATNCGITCGVGISTGLPFCGSVGGPKRRMYAVIGLDVVRAARLMQLSSGGEILCDEGTQAASRKSTALRFTSLPRFRLKGFDSPVRVFRLNTTNTAELAASICNVRQREREMLLATLDDAIAGRGRMIWLEGEEGSCTRTLVDDLVSRAAGRVKRLGVPVRAQDSPHSPWVSVCADLFGLRGVQDIFLRQAQVEPFSAQHPEVAPLLNDLLGTHLAELPETRTLTRAERSTRNSTLLFALIAELAHKQSVLVILENVHRFNTASWELVHRLAQDVEHATLLLTSTPNTAQRELRDAASTMRIVLNPLDTETALDLACDWLGAEQLGIMLTTQLRESAECNPGKLKQECDRLIAEEQLVTENGTCELVDDAAIPVSLSIHSTASKLVGRDTERISIAASLDAVMLGPSRVILVEGEIGAGKSRLLTEMRVMANDRAMLMVEGHCSSVEEATPYYPWREVYEQLLGLPGLTDPTERGMRVTAALLSRPKLLSFAPLLNGLLGLTLPEDEVVRQMTGQTRADNLHDLMIGLLDTIVDGRPALIQFEDAQWSDSASWKLAKLIQERVGRVVIAFAIRRASGEAQTDYQGFASTTVVDRIVLEALDEAETRELARSWLCAERIADQLGSLIWRKTLGNPLFIEHIVEHLSASGLVEIRDGLASLRTTSGEELVPVVPDTIRGLITARIDRLRQPHQLTIKVSSVVGPLFPSRVLKAIYPDPASIDALPEHCTTLIREHLLRQDKPAPDAVYDFPSPTLLQVCYELLPRHQRKRLHQCAAEWFQSHHTGSVLPHFRLIAHHWGRAGVADRQVEYLALAGHAAMRDGAFREAITGFTELLQSSEARYGTNAPPGEIANRAAWEYQLGEAYFGLGELPLAAEHLRTSLLLRRRTCRHSTSGLVLDGIAQAVLQLTRRLRPWRTRAKHTDPATREAAAAYLRLGRICYYTNDFLPGINATLRALNIGETAGPSQELATAYATATILTGLLNWHRAARNYARMAEAVARQVRQMQNLSVVLSYLCMYHLGQGVWERVETLALESLDFAERLGDHHQCGEVASILAMLRCFRADYPAALLWAARVIEVAKRSGNKMHLAWATNIEGECNLRLGQSEEAAMRLSESAAILRGNMDRTEEIRIEGMLAALAARKSDWVAARAHADAAEAVVRQTSAVTCSTLEGFAGVAEARFCLAENDPSNRQARKAAKDALVALRKHARLYPIGRPRTAVYEGRLHHLSGSPMKAVRVWFAGLELALRLQLPYDAALLHHTLAYCLPVGSPERREHLQAAIRGYDLLGMTFEVRRLQATM
jgi:predicted ATPase/class 3 adenylate cyclase